MSRDGLYFMGSRTQSSQLGRGGMPDPMEGRIIFDWEFFSILDREEGVVNWAPSFPCLVVTFDDEFSVGDGLAGIELFF